MNQFDRLEALAQRLIEGSFQRLFRIQFQPADLAHHLAAAIENGKQAHGAVDLIPNHYQILLNPADYWALIDGSDHHSAVADLHTWILGLVQEMDYRLAGPLHVWLEQQENIPPGQVKIKTAYETASNSPPWDENGP